MMQSAPVDSSPLAVLRRLRGPVQAPQAGERCDLCSTAIADDHRHLVDVEGRSLLCACRACALLFDRDGAAAGRFRSVPTDVYTLGEDAAGELNWDRLQIPVGVAFFLRHSGATEVSAFYPGPAGATESLLPLGAFDELADGHLEVASLRPDVEALLVRLGRGGPECYIVPVDVCYELAGMLRQSWRGFDGGTQALRGLDELFERVRRRARPLPVERRG